MSDSAVDVVDALHDVINVNVVDADADAVDVVSVFVIGIKIFDVVAVDFDVADVDVDVDVVHRLQHVDVKVYRFILWLIRRIRKAMLGISLSKKGFCLLKCINKAI